MPSQIFCSTGCVTNQNQQKSLLRHPLSVFFSLDFCIFILYIWQRFLNAKKRGKFKKKRQKSLKNVCYNYGWCCLSALRASTVSTRSSRRCWDVTVECAGSLAAFSVRCVPSTYATIRSTSRSASWCSEPGPTTRPRWISRSMSATDSESSSELDVFIQWVSEWWWWWTNEL